MGNVPVGLVVSWTSDLFLRSRIGQVASSLGLTTQFASDITELRTLLSRHPKVMILDLASDEYDPISVARVVKKEWPGLLLLGFYPHVRKELEAKARNAGVDFVVPNSGLQQFLRKILQTELDKS